MYELLGAMWWLGAILGVTEGRNDVMYVAGIVGTSYFIRAFVKYITDKE